MAYYFTKAKVALTHFFKVIFIYALKRLHIIFKGLASMKVLKYYLACTPRKENVVSAKHM